MKEKELVTLLQTHGTRLTVRHVLQISMGAHLITAILVSEILCMLEARCVIRRGNIAEFLSRSLNHLASVNKQKEPCEVGT